MDTIKDDWGAKSSLSQPMLTGGFGLFEENTPYQLTFDNANTQTCYWCKGWTGWYGWHDEQAEPIVGTNITGIKKVGE
jgi:hypothetical protein